jgi:hypothetical protein
MFENVKNWRKMVVPIWLVIASVAVLAVSAILFFYVRAQPSSFSEENTMMAYEHRGEFGYTAHLTPSYLYGPTPVETETVPDPQYPTAIIEAIDFTYRYAPIGASTEVVKVDGILSNEDIWEKRIKVVPYTSQTGDFVIRFSLDIEEIEELYSEIEEELGFSASPHTYTFEVNVTADKEEFVHQLPVTLGGRLITIPADLEHSQACGSGEFYYTIYLAENSIYGDSATLTPPELPETAPATTIIKPGDYLFINLMDSLDFAYEYEFQASRTPGEVTSDLSIKATIQAMAEQTNGEEGEAAKLLWSKDYPILTERGSGGTVSAEFPLDYEYYMAMLDTIRSETGASASSYNLIITATTQTTAHTDYGRIDEVFVQTLTADPSGGVLDWEEDLIKITANDITTTVTVPNEGKVMGMTLQGASILFTVLTIVFLTESILLTAGYFLTRPRAYAVGNSRVEQINKKYQQRIAEATGKLPVEGDKVIDLKSIDDLVKVADELARPIIYERSATWSGPHRYYVTDGDTCYRYSIGAGGYGEEEV